MSGAGEMLQMRFYFGERDRDGDGPLDAAVIAACAHHGVSGAALLRAVEGFGAKHQMRTDRMLTLSEDPPLVAVAVGESGGIEKIDGYVEAIYVNEGATVSKGQLLFKISNPLYEQAVVTANAAIKSAIADVNAAKMDVEKVRPLVEKDIVSAYELKSAQFTLESKEAALAQANATLVNAQTNVGYTFLRAPEAGVIGSIPYKIGALVSSTTTSPLTMLSTISDVYAYFSLNEKQLLNLSERLQGATWEDKLKQLPPVTLVLANDSEYTKKGHVETASGLISTETGTASLKALFPNPQGIIRSGASATIKLPRVIDTALLVPQSSTYELQNKRFVYLVLDNNMVVSTSVTATASNDGQFMIVTKGLKAGDKVLIGGSNLKDSTKIVPKPANADSLNRVFKASQS